MDITFVCGASKAALMTSRSMVGGHYPTIGNNQPFSTDAPYTIEK
jgi:hypothetical protein